MTANHARVIQIGPPPVKAQIAVARDRVLLLAPDGTLWSWEPGAEVHPVGTGCDWKSIALGWNGFWAIKTNGTLWRGPDLWGGSNSPWVIDLLQLKRPLPWGELARVKQVEDWNSFALSACVLGLRNDGTLHGFGLNWGGILGSGPFRVHKGPLQIGHRRDWVALGASGWVAVGVTADGSVWAWGKRVDKTGFPVKVRQLIAQWAGKLGIRMNSDILSSRPVRILQFRMREPKTNP